MIYAYQKTPDQYTIHTLHTPDGSTELATIAGVTYTHVPDDAERLHF